MRARAAMRRAMRSDVREANSVALRATSTDMATQARLGIKTSVQRGGVVQGGKGHTSVSSHMCVSSHTRTPPLTCSTATSTGCVPISSRCVYAGRLGTIPMRRPYSQGISCSGVGGVGATRQHTCVCSTGSSDPHTCVCSAGFSDTHTCVSSGGSPDTHTCVCSAGSPDTPICSARACDRTRTARRARRGFVFGCRWSQRRVRIAWHKSRCRALTDRSAKPLQPPESSGVHTSLGVLMHTTDSAEHTFIRIFYHYRKCTENVPQQNTHSKKKAHTTSRPIPQASSTPNAARTKTEHAAGQTRSRECACRECA